MVQNCSKCGVPKELSADFYFKDSQKKNGWRPSCKVCDREKNIAYYNKNRDELTRKNVERQRRNIEQTRVRKKRYQDSERAKTKRIEWKKTYTPPEKTAEEKAIFRKKANEWNRAYKNRHPDRIKAYAKKYKPVTTLEQRKRYNKASYNNIMADPYRRFNAIIKSAISCSIKKGYKMRSFDILTFTIPELRNHLQSLWLPEMNWDNYGKRGWHIDHKKPISSFDMSDPEEIKKCWALDNLQPLWWRDNLVKGAIYEGKNYGYKINVA